TDELRDERAGGVVALAGQARQVRVAVAVDRDVRGEVELDRDEDQPRREAKVGRDIALILAGELELGLLYGEAKRFAALVSAGAEDRAEVARGGLAENLPVARVVERQHGPAGAVMDRAEVDVARLDVEADASAV